MNNQRITLKQAMLPSFTGSKLAEAYTSMLQTEFLLPQDAMAWAVNQGWIIHPIQVCDNVDWKRSKHLMQANCQTLVMHPNNSTIIDNAKWLGVSIREHKTRGIKHAVVKLWLHTAGNYSSKTEHSIHVPTSGV